MRRRNLLILICAFMCLMMFSGKETFAAGTDLLTDEEKNSSYGFFVWLSDNADTSEEREDAATAAQILTNKVPSGGDAVVFNDGHIVASHTLGVSYEQLLSQTSIGAENDATSIDCLRDAIHFVTQGNEYRAKENLDPLMISSGLMAMAEVDANYQGYNGIFAHSNIFAAMENLAYRMVDGTWKYGKVSGMSSDEPYEGWYTEEKENYDTGNGGQTEHYETLTDRQGVMTTTGFGVRHRFTTESLTATDGQDYDCLMDNKYYSQQFSNNSTSYFYYAGSGVTPEKYEAYLNEYYCAVIGHKLTETAAADPSCTKEGNSKYYTCSNCGKYFSDPDGKAEIANNSWILSKTTHVLKEVPSKDATTTADGNIKYWECNSCGKLFGDAEGTKEIEKADTIIPQLKEDNTEPDQADPIEKAKANLSEIIAEAKGLSKENFTEDSFKALQDAISAAETVLAKNDATAEELKKASESIKAAIGNLIEKQATETTENAPTVNEEVSAEPSVNVGDTVKYKSNKYKVLSVKGKTVAFTKAKNSKSVVVPASIIVNGETYKVTQINASAFTAKKIRNVTIGKNVKVIKKNAFKGSKATKIVLKTKLLKKTKVKGCLKGSKVKTIQVKVSSKKSVNKKSLKTYKKYFTKANAGRKVTVK